MRAGSGAMALSSRSSEHVSQSLAAGPAGRRRNRHPRVSGPADVRPNPGAGERKRAQENAPGIRRRICEGAAWLGVALDEARNAAGDLVISTPSSEVQVLVVPTDEQAMILHLTRERARA